MSGVTAKWSNLTEENTLTNVSFSVKAGELLVVVGPVGSGKVTQSCSSFYMLNIQTAFYYIQFHTVLHETCCYEL